MRKGSIEGGVPIIVSSGARVDASAVDISTSGYANPIFTVLQLPGVLSLYSPALDMAWDVPELHVADLDASSDTGPVLAALGFGIMSMSGCKLTSGGVAGFVLEQDLSSDAEAHVLDVVDSHITLTNKLAPAFVVGATGTGTINLHNTCFDGRQPAELLHVGSTLDALPMEHKILPWIPGSGWGTKTLRISESKVGGDVAVREPASVYVQILSHSEWSGAVVGGLCEDHVAVMIDQTSRWILTADSAVSGLWVDGGDLSRIVGNGHTVWYDPCGHNNRYLHRKSWPLEGGGWARPRAKECVDRSEGQEQVDQDDQDVQGSQPPLEVEVIREGQELRGGDDSE